VSEWEGKIPEERAPTQQNWSIIPRGGKSNSHGGRGKKFTSNFEYNQKSKEGRAPYSENGGVLPGKPYDKKEGKCSPPPTSRAKGEKIESTRRAGVRSPKVGTGGHSGGKKCSAGRVRRKDPGPRRTIQERRGKQKKNTGFYHLNLNAAGEGPQRLEGKDLLEESQEGGLRGSLRRNGCKGS